MKQGEIYRVDLGSTLGRELSGTRAVLVVSADVFNVAPILVLVVIGFESGTLPQSLGTLVPATASGLTADVVFWPTQIRALDPQRFPDPPVGVVPSDLFKLIMTALKEYLDIVSQAGSSP